MIVVFQILTNLSSTCSDYGIVMYLVVFKKVMTIIQIVVPIILILMASIQVAKMMINPDDKKNMSSLKNKIVATIIVFFVPFAVNLCINLLPDNYNIAACWEAASNTSAKMN